MKSIIQFPSNKYLSFLPKKSDDFTVLIIVITFLVQPNSFNNSRKFWHSKSGYKIKLLKFIPAIGHLPLLWLLNADEYVLWLPWFRRNTGRRLGRYGAGPRRYWQTFPWQDRWLKVCKFYYLFLLQLGKMMTRRICLTRLIVASALCPVSMLY